jgi:hypothetical protein
MKIPTITKEPKMAETGIKGLIGKKMTKSVKFMGDDVKISKMSVSEVLEVQEKAKSLAENDGESFEVLKTVIKLSVEGASELGDDDFNNFPLDELSKLSAEIMKWSGLGDNKEGK